MKPDLSRFEPSPAFLAITGCIHFPQGETLLSLLEGEPNSGDGHGDSEKLLSGLKRASLLKYLLRTEEALAQARELHVLTRSLDFGWPSALAELSLADIYLFHHQFEVADKRLEALQAQITAAGDEGLSRYCGAVATAWRQYIKSVAKKGELDTSRWREVPEFQEEAERTPSRNSIKRAAIATALLSRGLAHRITGRRAKAVEHLRSVVGIASREGWRLAEGAAIRELGKVAFAEGNVTDAVELLNEARLIFEDIDYEFGLYNVHDAFAEAYLQQGDIRAAHHHTVLLLDYYNSRDLGRYFTGAYSRLGQIHFARGRYDEALECLNKDLGVARTLDDMRAFAKIQLQLGRIQQFKNNLLIAREHFEKSLTLFSDLGEWRMVAEVQIPIAECALANHNPESALVAVRDAEMRQMADPDPALTAQIERIHGIIEREHGDVDAALHYLMGALKRLTDTRRHALVAVDLRIEIARSLVALGDRRQAIAMLKEAIEVAQRLGMDPLVEQALAELERLDTKEAATVRYRPYLMKQALASAQRAGIRDKAPERTFVTILFVDIRGFTALSESLDVDALGFLVNEYLEVMSDAVIDHEGEVNKFIGDAVMGVWLSGEKHEERREHAKNAVLAGLTMLKEIENFNQRRAVHGQPPIRVGVGISSGIVVAGSFGSRVRREYSVLGDVVNTASRLEGLGDNSVIISETTYALTAEAFPTAKPQAEVPVKGKKAPVKTWRLTRDDDPRTAASARSTSAHLRSTSARLRGAAGASAQPPAGAGPKTDA